MTYLLWQRGGASRIASPKLVLRAAEVPLLADAQALRDALEQMHTNEQARLAGIAAQARDAARVVGLDEGRQAARDEVAAGMAALAQRAADERERLRSEVGALALQVVRKLLGAFAADELLHALADTAAQELLPDRPLALVVHPERCDAVRARLERRSDGDAAGLRCDVRGDPACALDACRLETEFGSIDASLDAQLARLEAAWAGACA